MTSTRRRTGPARSARPLAARAFSLVELVLVLGIIAAAAAIAMPRLANSFASARADAAARRIAADMTLAQTRARATSKSQTLVFTSASHSYQIPGLVDPNTRAGTYTVELSKSPYDAKLGKVDFAGAASVSFSMYGVPSAAGEIVITAGNASRTVTVNADTGQATIK